MPKRTLVLVAFAVLVGFVEARFEWRDVIQQVAILPDGTILVNDERTLWTNEDFGEAFICIEHSSNERVVLLPGSGAIDPGPPATTFTQACASGDAGTELVVRNNVRIQQRRVRFRYRLEGSVEPFSDVVQWYWEIFGRKNVETVGYALTVTAPGTMAAPFDAYVHRFSNPEQPFVGLADQRNVLTVRFDRIPAGEGVEIRYLMDPAVFTVRGTRQGFEELLEDEARIAGILENQRRFGAIRRNPLWGLIGLAILLWLANGVWQAYNRYGREPDIPSMKYPFEPPSDIPPAAVAAIQTQNRGGMASGPAFHATIMDLARRGYGEFTGKGRKFEMMLDLDKPTEGLESFEADVLDYLKKAAQQRKRGDPNHLEFRELRAYSQKHASRFLTSWRKKPRDWIESRFGGPLTSAESQRAARRWGGRAALAVAVCGISAFLTFGVARIEFIVAGVLCAILGFIAGGALPAWREEVAAEVYGWQGFKRTLTDYTQMKGAPDDFFRPWDRYFVYAASLGVAQQFLKNLNRAAPLAGIDETTLARHGAWMGTGNVSDFASLSRSVTSLSSALSAASASGRCKKVCVNGQITPGGDHEHETIGQEESSNGRPGVQH